MNIKTRSLFAGMAFAAGLVMAGGTSVALHAQDQQTTTTRESTTSDNGVATTTRESTTTTSGPLGAPSPGYADFGYQPDNVAAHRGYNDGYDKGISDHNTGHSYRPTSDHYYNHPIGYNGGALSKDEYNRIYKEAFLHGYERGYRSANK